MTVFMQKTILLIDDDEEELYILNLALEQTGIDYYCVWANGCEQAMHVLQEFRPDFIFLDINMPRLNGIDCLKKLKQLESLNNSVFVMYSTYFSEADRDKTMQLGANICMRKAANIKQLFKQLNNLFNNKYKESP